MSKPRLLSASQVRAIVRSLGSAVLPEIQKDYLDAVDYVLGPKDRAGARVKVSGGDDYSDPTGDTAADQERNADELRRIGKRLEGLEKDALALRSRIRALFNASPDEHRYKSDGHIPSAEEEFQRQQAVKAQTKRALNEEKVVLEKRLGEIDRGLESLDQEAVSA